MVPTKTEWFSSLGGFLLLTSLEITHADRDYSYYKPGRENPNIYAEKMYWADASNVLEDLDQFSGLYVSFHHCAWTQMQAKSYNGYDGDGDGDDVNEDDYWYLGSVPPFGANVAFSLYGAMAGEEFTGCNQNTYINSFYTKYGFEVFSNAMYYAGQYGFGYYGNNNGGGSSSSTCQGGYGVGCDYNNGFAVHTYSTDACDPSYFSGVSNSMSSFNQNMQNVQCVQIYDADYYDGYYSGTGLEALAYSSACFYQNYWSPDGQCPDPFGKLAEYQKNFNNGVKQSQKNEIYSSYRKVHRKAQAMWHFGWIFFVSAAILVGVKLMMRTGAFTLLKSKIDYWSHDKWINNAEPEPSEPEITETSYPEPPSPGRVDKSHSNLT